MTELHPTPFQLERFSSGERVEVRGEQLAAHVERCAECGAFLHTLVLEKAQFLATHPAPTTFVRNLQQRAAEPTAWRTVQSWPVWTWQPKFRWSASFVLAAVVVALHWPFPQQLHEAEAPPTSASDLRVFVAKGGANSLAVIRKRQADQQLQSGRISVIPGDELRVRFSLPARAKVAAGILVDDGTWVPFFEGEFEAGTHTPEATLTVDSNPSSGTVLFGSPADVEHARTQGNFARVEMAELVWTGPP